MRAAAPRNLSRISLPFGEQRMCPNACGEGRKSIFEPVSLKVKAKLAEKLLLARGS
jgi:hypothetical protein